MKITDLKIDVVRVPIQSEEGYIVLPTKLGFGIELNEEVVE